MNSFTDQLGRKLSLQGRPQRIVSLVPSQTELLFDLGLEKEVIGITKFCVHPAAWLASKNIIGGTKNLNLEKIAALQPDFIIGNKEENERSQIEWLSERFPVWMSDIENLDQALDMMIQLGHITGKEAEAQPLCTQIREDFDALAAERTQPHPGLLYLIWHRPIMAAGKNTFIHEMIRAAGFSNALENHPNTRYPELSEAEITKLRPDYIFLSSEPYPFSDKHIEEYKTLFPGSEIIKVDGEMFSWYGSRLTRAPGYFRRLQQQLFAARA